MSCSFYSYSQNAKIIKAQIAPWYQNKPGAVSISFDDAGYTQYTSAYPILEKYQVKGTFSVVGEWVGEQPGYSAEPGSFEIEKMGWQQLMELFVNGHELAAHGYNHEKYDKQLPVPDLVAEMNKIKTLIESRTHARALTIDYPYSFASGNIVEAARETGFLFGRTGLDTINPPSPKSLYLLASEAVLNINLPDSVLFRKWIGQAKGNWLILMYHHLFPEDSKEMGIIHSHNVTNSYSIPPEAFEKQIKALVAAGYWLAPICEIGTYITERDHTEIRTYKKRKKIFIYTVSDLDQDIYNLPLTLEVSIPWKRVKIEGSIHDGIVETNNNKLVISVLPEKELILSKE